MTEKPNPFGWPFWLILAVAIFLLLALTIPSRRKPDQVRAISNLRQLGFALSEFEGEYGSFPNDETAKLVKIKHPSSTDLTGTSSNALFRQLFAAGITQNEQAFYARVSGTKKPDDDISPGNLLEKGEVAYAYIAGLSTKGNPARPIAFAPIIPGTTRFDPKAFDGRAVYLRIDNSVVSINIDADGNAIMAGVNMLSPENPIWEGKAPDIRYPEL